MTEVPETPSQAVPSAGPGSAPVSGRRVVAAGVIGTVVEWYDFYLYGTAAALIFGKLFFPSAGPAAGVLLALATYGVGYVMRPVGGVLLSQLGDRIGRRQQLLASLVLIGTSTGLIGLLPTSAAIGVAAPILLVALRLVQGIGAGAEFGGALTLIAEHSRPERRGLRTSLPAAATATGIMIGNGMFALLNLLPDAQFEAWGWRVPFLFGFLAVVVGVLVRRGIPESTEFQRFRRRNATTTSPLAALWREQRRDLLVAVAMQGALALNIAAVTVYGVAYATQQLGVPAGVALTGTTCASLSGLVMAPLAGRLSDRFGRRTVLTGCLVLALVQAFLFFWLLQTRDPVPVVLAFVLLNSAVWMITGASGAFLTELFDVRYRTTAIAVARESTTALAGLGPLLYGALVAASGSSVPVSLLLTAAGLVAVLVMLFGLRVRRVPHDDVAIAATSGPTR